MPELIDLGLIDYKEALLLQRKLFQDLIEKKKSKKQTKEFLLMAEHPPVITLGRHANTSNLLFPKEALNNAGIELFEIERGGDVTCHEPGQLVIYPIIDMNKYSIGVKKYVYLLEDCVIKSLEPYNINGIRWEGAPGVWLSDNEKRKRKISALGIKCKNYCTMHGLSVNVNNNLSTFNYINPCGFRTEGVTSMKKERERKVDMTKFKEEISDIFLSLIFSLKK